MLEPREHLVPDPAFDGHFNLLRAYVAPLDVAGVKVVGDYVGNWKLGLPSELALLTLYDPRTGVPRAIIDATAITEWRTGAVTAIGARTSRGRAQGCSATSGRAARRSRTSACSTACSTSTRSACTSARPESRAAFGERLEQELGKPVRVMDDVESTVRGADVVVEATRLSAPEPILRTEWIAPAALRGPLWHDERGGAVAHLDHGQGVRRRLGPMPERALRRAAGARRAGPRHGRHDRRPSSADVVAGTRPGRERDEERILFWHRGLATTDIALGQAILDQAVEQGIGTLLPYR